MPALAGEPWRGLAKVDTVELAGDRHFTVSIDDVSPTTVSGDQATWTGNPGSSFTLRFEWSTELLPLHGEATVGRIRVYDADSGAQIGDQWTVAMAGGIGVATRTFHFDDNPLNESAGVNRYGTLEIWLEVERAEGLGTWGPINSRGQGTPPGGGAVFNWARGYLHAPATLVNYELSDVVVGGVEQVAFAFPDGIHSRSTLNAGPYNTSSTIRLRHEQGAVAIRSQAVIVGNTGVSTWTWVQTTRSLTGGRLDDTFAIGTVDVELELPAGSFGGDPIYTWQSSGHFHYFAKDSDVQISSTRKIHIGTGNKLLAARSMGSSHPPIIASSDPAFGSGMDFDGVDLDNSTLGLMLGDVIDLSSGGKVRAWFERGTTAAKDRHFVEAIWDNTLGTPQVQDASPNSNHLSFIGTIPSVLGKSDFGMAAAFDGIDRDDNTMGYQAALDIPIQSDTTIDVWFERGTPASPVRIHARFRFDITGGVVTTSYNGVQDGTANITVGPAANQAGIPVKIGRANHNAASGGSPQQLGANGGAEVLISKSVSADVPSSNWAVGLLAGHASIGLFADLIQSDGSEAIALGTTLIPSGSHSRIDMIHVKSGLDPSNFTVPSVPDTNIAGRTLALWHFDAIVGRRAEVWVDGTLYTQIPIISIQAHDGVTPITIGRATFNNADSGSPFPFGSGNPAGEMIVCSWVSGSVAASLNQWALFLTPKVSLLFISATGTFLYSLDTGPAVATGNHALIDMVHISSDKTFGTGVVPSSPDTANANTLGLFQMDSLTDGHYYANPAYGFSSVQFDKGLYNRLESPVYTFTIVNAKTETLTTTCRFGYVDAAGTLGSQGSDTGSPYTGSHIIDTGAACAWTASGSPFGLRVWFDDNLTSVTGVTSSAVFNASRKLYLSTNPTTIDNDVLIGPSSNPSADISEWMNVGDTRHITCYAFNARQELITSGTHRISLTHSHLHNVSEEATGTLSIGGSGKINASFTVSSLGVAAKEFGFTLQTGTTFANNNTSHTGLGGQSNFAQIGHADFTQADNAILEEFTFPDLSGNGHDLVRLARVSPRAPAILTSGGYAMGVEAETLTNESRDVGPGCYVKGNGINFTGNDPFCIEMKFAVRNDTSGYLLSKNSGTSLTNINFYVFVNGSNDRVEVRIRHDGTTTLIQSANGSIIAQTSYALAINYDGTVIRVYLSEENGTALLLGEITTSNIQDASSGGRLMVGRRDSSSSPSQGDFYIDELRISSVSRYPNGYDPSAAAFVADAFTTALWTFDTFVTPAKLTVVATHYGTIHLQKTSVFDLGSPSDSFGIGEDVIYAFIQVTDASDNILTNQTLLVEQINLAGTVAQSKTGKVNVQDEWTDGILFDARAPKGVEWLKKVSYNATFVGGNELLGYTQFAMSSPFSGNVDINVVAWNPGYLADHLRPRRPVSIAMRFMTGGAAVVLDATPPPDFYIARKNAVEDGFEYIQADGSFLYQDNPTFHLLDTRPQAGGLDQKGSFGALIGSGGTIEESSNLVAGKYVIGVRCFSAGQEFVDDLNIEIVGPHSQHGL